MTSSRSSRFPSGWLPALTAAAMFALSGPLASPVQAQADPVVAKVNGTEIKESDLKAAEEDIGAQLPPMAPEAKKDYL
ncbi:MAG TPA: peptidylprolyl isomerase, partial [Pseudorhodoplanes sp.]|nr:peptidylprolyl isomerase [Pseudorhodoplanes sp.]